MCGKHFKVDEAATGVNFAPFHPHCRTTTIKYDRGIEGITRIARDKNVKNVTVPFDMKYDEWKKWVNKEYNDSRISGDFYSKFNFRNNKIFDKHFEKHKDEFGNLDKVEYLNSAKKLLMAKLDKNILGFISKEKFV